MKKKHIILLVLQTAVVLTAGFWSKDAVFSILVSGIGVVFNLLVSLNHPTGFLFGFCYAITNGMLAFQTGVYATFAFMIFLQAPMAVYSFVNWRKKKKNDTQIMKKMSGKATALMLVFMMLTGFVMCFVLSKLQSANVVLDAVFFVFSVTACLLLAFCYKNAYVITLLSGLGGTVLWFYQMVTIGKGLSVAVFYAIVSINSILAVYEQYFKKTAERSGLNT